MPRWWVHTWLVLVLQFGALRPAVAAGVTDDDVRRAITVLAGGIREGQNADGSWTYEGYPVGITALMVLALHQAGADETDDAVRRGVDFILQQAPATTYGEGLALCALEPWASRRLIRQRMEKSVDFLCRIQSNDGGWSYKAPGGHDFSNTQFAVLGLGVAQRVGIPVPRQVTANVRALWVSGQNQDGGWGYVGHTKSTLSMTCAGVASLSLLGVEFERAQSPCGKYSHNKSILGGLRYISAELAKGNDAVNGRWQHYTLYALERVAVFLDLKTIGGMDWYRRGAPLMVETALKPGAKPEHAFALLFLCKAATPVAIAKWRWDGDWNNDHADMQNWMKHSSVTLGQPLDWVPATLDRLDSPAAKASLIHVSGHRKIRFSNQEVEFLRAYLKDGGTVVAEPCCNSKTFARSFALEASRRLSPGQEGKFVKVPESHPLYRSVHVLSGADVEVYQLAFGGCRKERVFLLDRDIGCALNQEPGTEKRRDSAFRVADNVLGFALRLKPPAGKLDKKILERDEFPMVVLSAAELTVRREGETEQFRCPFGRLKHAGDWQADRHFYGSMKRILSDQKAVPDFDGEAAVDPSTSVLFSVPVLFATGHGNPDLRREETANLRLYLQNGGVLIASACCSNEDFDRGFRALVAQTLPNDVLEEVPVDDAIWQRPFDLRSVPPQGNERLQKTYPKQWGPLLGVRRDGRWVVLYSPVDFCCSFEGDLQDEVVGYDLHAASRLVTNLLAEVMRIE